jgi:transposase
VIQPSRSRDVAMATVVELRAGFTAPDLRRLAQPRRDAGQFRRLLALAVIYQGDSRSEASRAGGVGLQTMRDWVLRFNRDRPDGLIDGEAPGGRPRLDSHQQVGLAAVVESGPILMEHGIVRWRLVDTVHRIRDEFAVSVSTRTPSRDLRAMGHRILTARPRHHPRAPVPSWHL